MSIKIFISLMSISLFFILPCFILAQEPAITDTADTAEAIEMVNLDENVQAEDLGIKDPKILPDSKFYFLKNWARGIQQVLTFNPLKKAELRMKFVNEKLMETKKIIELKKNPEIIKKAMENYQQEIEKIKEQSEKIREKAKENPKIESFLDKFIHQQTLHQKLLDRLETQAPTPAFKKIKEARERHLERFKDVMLKLEDRKEVIAEKLDKILEEQKGSEFKNLKNLEILKKLEEKVPEEIKDVIQKPQEEIMERLQKDLEKMTPEKQERLKNYIEKISGQKEKHLEILENLKTKIKEAPLTPIRIELKEKLEETKTTIIEKVEEKLKEMGCPLWVPPVPDFCKEGRVILEKDPKTGCPLSPKCLIPGEIEIPEETKVKPVPVPQLPVLPNQPEKPQLVEIICPTLWDPVCGKDGKTYSNVCFTKLAKVEIAYKGRCEEKECKTDADCPQLRCGPSGTKCIGVQSKCIDGKCQVEAISPSILELPEESKHPKVCIQVITPAIGPDGICKEYFTPCDVPNNWKVVDRCPERKTEKPIELTPEKDTEIKDMNSR